MSKQGPMIRAPIDSWQAERLRVTAFPTPDAQVDASTWWEKLMGESPETSTSRPKLGAHQEEGPYNQGRLILATQPNRIDWLFVLTDNENSGKPLLEASNTYMPIMLRWLAEQCPTIQRLAFGAIVYLPVSDHAVGYRQLSAYLPAIQIDPEGSSDFFYQVNRPRRASFGVAEFIVNRLTKWSVSKSMGFELTPVDVRSLSGLEQFACRLELDINTSQEFDGELPRDQLGEIFQQLVRFGMEIIAEGDRP